MYIQYLCTSGHDPRLGIVSASTKTPVITGYTWGNMSHIHNNLEFTQHSSTNTRTLARMLARIVPVAVGEEGTYMYEE